MPRTPVVLEHGPSNVEYLISGSGPGLVLVHGTFGDAEVSWQPLIDAVQGRYTVVSVNLAGSGRTTAPDRVTVDDLAIQVAGAAADAGLDRYHLVGHSLGAVTAAVVAARHAQRVDSLLLHAPWSVTDARGRFQFELWERILQADRRLLAKILQLTGFRPDTLVEADDAAMSSSASLFTAMLSFTHAAQVAAARNVDIAGLLSGIKTPTRVLVSAYDQIIAPAQQHAVAAAIPGADHREFAAGHALPLEDPTAFASAVIEFLDRQPDVVALTTD
ncbi:alpha/beta fold hydrolase [Nocardia heshunensis]